MGFWIELDQVVDGFEIGFRHGRIDRRPVQRARAFDGIEQDLQGSIAMSYTPVEWFACLVDPSLGQ